MTSPPDDLAPSVRQPGGWACLAKERLQVRHDVVVAPLGQSPPALTGDDGA